MFPARPISRRSVNYRPVEGINPPLRGLTRVHLYSLARNSFEGSPAPRCQGAKFPANFAVMRSRDRCLPVIFLPGLVGLATTILLGLATTGCVNNPAAVEDTTRARGMPLEIELDRPAPEQHIRRPVPFIEVSGRAGALPFFASDVVVVIDHSTLALLASGIDVDEDGVVGRTRNWVRETKYLPMLSRSWTTDPDDTVHALQVRVAQALVQSLALRQNRLGLASFSLRTRWRAGTLARLTDKPAVVAPVGSADSVLARLADFPAAHEQRRTDLSRLLELAAELLDEAAPDLEPARPRAILLLSLGRPSAPDGIHWSSRRALELAGELGERGIAVWAVPFGIADFAYLDELTRGTGGSVVPLDQLEAQFGAPVPSDLRPRELEIENVTLHAEASNLRVFPDGRFDAFVPVGPGPNTLEIRAVLADGHRTTLRRLVHYERVSSVEQAP